MKAGSTTATRGTSVRQPVVKQALAPVAKQEDKPIKFNVAGKDVELSIALTQAYFCPQASPAEAYVFNSWCAHNGLDPWRREAYLVKYGNNPAQMLTAKDAFTKRAEANPRYQGSKAGVVVINREGKLENRVGELVLDGEELVGGWADVYVKDYVTPISAVVGFRERCQYKDGKPQAKWASSPGLMIRKCAIVAALREAFPNDVGGMYVPDEMGFAEDETASASVPIERNDVKDVAYTDLATGEVVEPDDVADSFFDQEE